MKANYAEICRVANLEADFQQVACSFFSEIFTTLLWNINNSNAAKKNKRNIFLDKNLKKKLFYYWNCICQTNFWP